MFLQRNHQMRFHRPLSTNSILLALRWCHSEKSIRGTIQYTVWSTGSIVKSCRGSSTVQFSAGPFSHALHYSEPYNIRAGNPRGEQDTWEGHDLICTERIEQCGISSNILAHKGLSHLAFRRKCFQICVFTKISRSMPVNLSIHHI